MLCGPNLHTRISRTLRQLLVFFFQHSLLVTPQDDESLSVVLVWGAAAARAYPIKSSLNMKTLHPAKRMVIFCGVAEL